MKAMMSLYVAKTQFSKIVSEVERTGVHVVICRHNVPVVAIVPLQGKADPLATDATLKGAAFHGDPTAPLSDADWPKGLR